MTKKELDEIMEIVSGEIDKLNGGTRGMSQDTFREKVSGPWWSIKRQIEERLVITES